MKRQEDQRGYRPRPGIVSRALRRRWRSLAGSLVVVTALTYVGLELVPEAYESETTLSLDVADARTPGDAHRVLAEERFDFELTLLQSRTLMENVVETEGVDVIEDALDALPGSKAPTSALSRTSRAVLVWLDFEKSKPRKQRAIDQLAEAFSVSPSPTSSLVTAKLRLADPTAAAATLDAIVKVYLDTRTEVRKSDLSTRALEEQLERRKEQITLLDRAESELRGNASGQDFASERAQVLARLHEAQVNLDDNGGEIARLNAERAEMEARVDTLPAELRSEEVIIENPARQTMEQQITALKLERAALLERYKEASPPVRHLDERIENLTTLLSEEAVTRSASVKNEVHPVKRAFIERLENLKVQVAGMEAENRSLEKTQRELQATLTHMSAIDSDLDTIALERKIAQQGQEILERRRQGLEIASEFGNPRIAAVTIVSPPSVSSEPVYPNKKNVLTLVLLAAIGLGLGGSIWDERRRALVTEPEDLSRVEDVDYLGSFELSEESVKRWSREND